MKTLRQLSLSSDEKKEEHINTLLNKAEEKKDETYGMKKVHSIRIDCIMVAYYSFNPPKDLFQRKLKIFYDVNKINADENGMTTENKIITENEKVFMEKYTRALEEVRRNNLSLFDSVDYEFKRYRFLEWKKKEDALEWKTVQRKRRNRYKGENSR